MLDLAIHDDAVPLTKTQFGTYRVTGTRIPLERIVEEFHHGATPEQIADDYDTLHLADVYTVIGYYLRHRNEIDRYLLELEEECQRLEQQNVDQFELTGLRGRLLARKASVSK